MKSILIRSVTVLDSQSPYHRKQVDILIESGIIQKIADKGLKGEEVIEGKGLFVSPGWVDLRAFSGDPGYEQKEDLNSLLNAALSGGYTAVCTLPGTLPIVEHKEQIHYQIHRTSAKVVQVLPMAALSLGLKGEELTEMMDLHEAGAVAFTDSPKPIWHSDLMLRALQYASGFNGLIMTHAEDRYLSHGGQMNEGKMSTQLGLKGIPKLAEEIIVERDLKLLAYAGGRLHFAHISSPESLDKIRQAKKAGLPVTCDVSAAMLCIDEQALEHFDTVYKVNPPLRGKKDIEALWKGLADGTISAIASDHLPQDIENKALEFDQAAFGMEMLETAFAAANTFNGKLTLDQLVALFGEGPRKVLGLSAATITEKTVAELTIFSADQEWVVSEGVLASKSKNNPFIGKTLKGKAKAVITPKGVALCP